MDKEKITNIVLQALNNIVCNEEHWITIGADEEKERKGRHILVKDGETNKEATERKIAEWNEKNEQRKKEKSESKKEKMSEKYTKKINDKRKITDDKYEFFKKYRNIEDYEPLKDKFRELWKHYNDKDYQEMLEKFKKDNAKDIEEFKKITKKH